MVFSLFSRKDKVDPRKKTEAAAPLRQMPAAAPVRTGVTSVRDQPRSSPAQQAAAQQTMARIDAIESEMNLSTPDLPVARNPQPSVSVLNNPNTQPFKAPTTAVYAPNSQPMDFGTSAILGDTAGAGSLEILGSGFAPVLEEAAILFSNGQANEAASLLQSSIHENNLGPATQTVWMMLFDVYQALNRQNEFDGLSIDYAARFESSPPAWRGKKQDLEPSKVSSSHSIVVMAPILDGGVSKQVEQIQAATAKGRPVLLEFSKSTKIEPFGAELILKTLNAFKKAKREIAFSPVEKLVALCKAEVEPGRRDTSDAIWLLLLEGLRLLGQQQQFEDTSIDYCVTYEVSPPSWEPMPAWIRAEAAGPISISASEKAGTRAQDGVFHFVGDVNGSIAMESGLLTEYSASRRDIKIDCSELRRIDFVAAGQLQNQLTTMRTLGKVIVLFNVSIPVGTLFGVVGMNDVANIKLREF